MTQYKTCRSEPARDEAAESDISVGRHTAIASRLAPTMERCEAGDRGQ